MPNKSWTKDDVIRFRCTAKEKEVLESAAESEGLSLSAWLRQIVLRQAGLLPKS